MLDYMTVTESGEAYVDLSKLTREQATAIQEVIVDEAAGGSGDGVRERVKRTRFKLADKTKNLELLCRYHKLLTDKHELTGKDGEPMATSITVRFVTPGEENIG